MKITKALLIPLILAALQFLHIVDFMLIMPLGDQIMKVFDINPAHFSAIVGSYGYAAAISSFFGAFILDRFDRKNSIIFITIGFIVGTFLCGYAQDYYHLLIARIITGTFGGMVNAIVFTIVGDLYDIKKRSEIMGIIAAAFSVASAMGVPIGLTISDYYEWNTPFISLGYSAIPILVLLIIILPKMTSHLIVGEKRKGPIEIIGDLFRKPNQQKALLFILMLVISQFVIIPFFTPFLIRNVGLSQDDIKFVYLAGGIATMFTGPYVGRLASKCGREKVFFRMAFLSLVPILLITQLWEIHIGYVLVISVLFFVFISGRMIPANALMTSVVEPKNRGSFMSLHSSMVQLGIGVSTLIAGQIISEDGSMLTGFDKIGYLSLVLTIIVIFLTTRLRTEETEENQISVNK